MTIQLDYIPKDCNQIQVVDNMDQLLGVAWNHANAILYPRSQLSEFQKLEKHFRDLARHISGPQRDTDVRTRSLKKLEKYYKEISANEQKLCLDYIIADAKILEKQCTKYWELRVQRHSPTSLHFDGQKESVDYPHTIITTYSGRSTRWARDEDISTIKNMKPEPYINDLIHTFKAGDICKFNNEGDPSFFHGGNRGLRMTLIAR